MDTTLGSVGDLNHRECPGRCSATSRAVREQPMSEHTPTTQKRSVSTANSDTDDERIRTAFGLDSFEDSNDPGLAFSNYVSNGATRRKFLRGTTGGVASFAGLAFLSGSASAAGKRPNDEIRRMVDIDYEIWNNDDVSTDRLRDLYHPWWHKYSTRFGGPSMRGVASVLSRGSRDWITLSEYSMMINILRPATEPLDGRSRIVFEDQSSAFVKWNNPRSGGSWKFEGEFSASGKTFHQEGYGEHYWRGGKVSYVEMEGMDFVSFLQQVV